MAIWVEVLSYIYYSTSISAILHFSVSLVQFSPLAAAGLSAMNKSNKQAKENRKMCCDFCMSCWAVCHFPSFPDDLGTRGSKWPLSSSLSSLIVKRFLLSCVLDDREYLFKGVHIYYWWPNFKKPIANKHGVLVFYFVYCENPPQGYAQTLVHVRARAHI